MTTYYESEIINNQTIDFIHPYDLLIFDNPTLSASSLTVGFDEYYSRLTISLGSKTFTLSGNALNSVDARSVRFSDGSVLVLRENSSLGFGSFAFLGSSNNDYLIGSGAADILKGGDGNDRLDGRGGADIMKGGLGADTYIVDDKGDVVDEAPAGSARYLSTGADGLGFSNVFNGQISDNGKYLVFVSQSPVFENNPSNVSQIYLKNLQTGTLELISSSIDGDMANGWSERPSISADGRLIAFYSTASDLVQGDGNGFADIFVKDMTTGAITRASTDSAGIEALNGDSYEPRITPDGRFVIFSSAASNLVENDSLSTRDIFIKDLHTGGLSLISSTSEGFLANGFSGSPDFSDDARYVVFTSTANLVQGDDNSTYDVYLKDRQTNSTLRISEGPEGAQSNAGSFKPRITSDGRYVVFESFATNLVAGDDNGKSDVFLKDLKTGLLTCVSRGSEGVIGDGDSSDAAISEDGRYVVFKSFSTNLVENARSTLFVKDLGSGRIETIDVDERGSEPQFSRDGSFIYFQGLTDGATPNQAPGQMGVLRVANPFLLVDDGAVDTVRSSINYKLGANVENLVLTGTGDINGEGNALGNRLTGNSGDNVLTGGGGADRLSGGGGFDTASYATSNRSVTASLTDASLNSNDARGDAYASIENLLGTRFKDLLYGNSGANSLNGGSGSDVLLGGAGADKLLGGGDVDTVSYVTASRGVAASLRQGALNRGDAAGDVYSSIENLAGSSFADTLEGNSSANSLSGGLGNDVLIGGGAGDDLIGGNGSDTASYANASSKVTANLSDTAFNIGEALGDTYDSVENLAGSKYGDTLIGDNAGNRISGGDGADYIRGGAGADILLGGAGKDSFVYKSTSDSRGSANHDKIMDFQGDDQIVLFDIDANSTVSGNQKFSFIAAKAFSGHAGELRCIDLNEAIFIYGDVNGDKVADLILELDGGVVPSASDFVL